MLSQTPDHPSVEPISRERVGQSPDYTSFRSGPSNLDYRSCRSGPISLTYTGAAEVVQTAEFRRSCRSGLNTWITQGLQEWFCQPDIHGSCRSGSAMVRTELHVNQGERFPDPGQSEQLYMYSMHRGNLDLRWRIFCCGPGAYSKLCR